MPIAVRDVTWSESDSALQVVVPLKGVKPSKVDIFSTDTYLKVSFPPYLYEAYLFAEVHDSESKALVGNGKVLFTLTKKEPQLWGQLKKGEIIQNGKPVEKDGGEASGILSREEAQRLREEAVKASHERAEREAKAKAEKKDEERKKAVREQMKLDDEERQRIAAAKEQVTNEAMLELQQWKDDQLKRESALVGMTADRQPEASNGSAAHGGQETKTRSRCNKKKIFDTAPPPRDGGLITVSFTPRVFPTPSRESKAEEEQEWLKKMAEAAKVKAEQDKDLGDIEERDPLWLKDKGNEFYRQGNFLAAINAYSHAIRRGGGMPSLFSNRAACYLQLERYAECIKDCTIALELLDPPVPANLSSRVKAYVRRGSAYAKLEIYADALSDYENALKLNADNTELRNDANRIRKILQGTSSTRR